MSYLRTAAVSPTGGGSVVNKSMWCWHFMPKQNMATCEICACSRASRRVTDESIRLSSVCYAEYFTGQSTDEIHRVVDWCEDGNRDGLTLVHRLPVQNLRCGNRDCGRGTRMKPNTKSSLTFNSNNTISQQISTCTCT